MSVSEAWLEFTDGMTSLSISSKTGIGGKLRFVLFAAFLSLIVVPMD
jgi:hypothetical protein